MDPSKFYDSSEEHSAEAESVHSEPEIVPIEAPQHSISTNEVLKNIFMCKHCDKAYTRLEDCDYHETKEHDILNPNKCNLCSLSFGNRSILIIHLREFHASDKPYICVECDKGFGRRSDLKKHTIVHTGVRPYICPVCHKNFSRNTNLTKHLRIHSGHKPHVCPNCPRSFMNKSDLYRHYNIHFDEKLFKCTQCDAKFSRKDKLKNHEKKHVLQLAKGNPTKSLDLPLSTNGLMPHQDFNKINPELIDHNIQQHQNRLKPTSILAQQLQPDDHDNESMVIALDPYQDMNPYHHQNHPHDISTQPSVEESQPLNLSEQNFTVPDHIQNMELNFPGHVTGDVVTYQEPDKINLSFDKRKYLCDQCPNRFSSKSSLINHKNIHLGIRNHVCEVCQKAFLRKRELERHSVIHTGVKAFVCGTCNKSFGRKDKLIRHERIHAEDRNRMFKCGECPAMYNRKDGLLAHMKLHIMMLNENDDIGIKFETQTSESAIFPAPQNTISFTTAPPNTLPEILLPNITENIQNHETPMKANKSSSSSSSYSSPSPENTPSTQQLPATPVMEPPIYRFEQALNTPSFFPAQNMEPPIYRINDDIIKSFETQTKIIEPPIINKIVVNEEKLPHT